MLSCQIGICLQCLGDALSEWPRQHEESCSLLPWCSSQQPVTVNDADEQSKNNNTEDEMPPLERGRADSSSESDSDDSFTDYYDSETDDDSDDEASIIWLTNEGDQARDNRGDLEVQENTSIIGNDAFYNCLQTIDERKREDDMKGNDKEHYYDSTNQLEELYYFDPQDAIPDQNAVGKAFHLSIQHDAIIEDKRVETYVDEMEDDELISTTSSNLTA